MGLTGALLLRRSRRVGLKLLVVGTMLSYGFSIPFTASLLSGSLQPYPALTERALQSERPGAIVVLAGGLHEEAPEYGDGPTLHARTLGRARYAARLARQTGLPVLAAGGRPRGDKDPTTVDPPEAELMKEVLENEFGIPRVLTETASRDTWENAVNSAAILRERHADTILLVSNAAHLPRAVAAFQAQGLKVIPAPTLFFDDRPDPLDPKSWLPSATAIAEVHYDCYEWLGRWWYAVRQTGNPGTKP